MDEHDDPGGLNIDTRSGLTLIAAQLRTALWSLDGALGDASVYADRFDCKDILADDLDEMRHLRKSVERVMRRIVTLSNKVHTPDKPEEDGSNAQPR